MMEELEAVMRVALVLAYTAYTAYTKEGQRSAYNLL